MAQKTNYRFEKIERERKKAAKKAKREFAKQEKAADRRPSDADASGGSTDKA